jgi:hypothetical protein
MQPNVCSIGPFPNLQNQTEGIGRAYLAPEASLLTATPQIVDAKIRRRQNSSTPKFVDAKIRRRQNSSPPKFVNAPIRRRLKSSTKSPLSLNSGDLGLPVHYF